MGNCILIQKLEKCTMDNTEKFVLNGQSMYGKVIDVYDGDTVTLAFSYKNILWQHKCRIYGLDCAEIRTKNLQEKKVGHEAKTFLSNLILNKIVWIDFIENKNDKYGRLLASLKLNDQHIKTLMIENNFGYEYEGGKKVTFEDWNVN